MRVIYFFVLILFSYNSFSQNLDNQFFNTEWKIDELTYIDGIITHCFSEINPTDYEKELQTLYKGTTLKFLDSNFVKVITNRDSQDLKSNFIYYFFDNRKWKTDKKDGKILIEILEKRGFENFTILKSNDNLIVDFINVKLKLTKNN